MSDTPARTKRLLMQYYRRMAAHFGPTHWWPGETPFEIAIGAILTQNTAWSNVEKAIHNLKESRLLSPKAIAGADAETLQGAIRPSGYYRQKSERIRIFSEHLLAHYRGSMARMARRPDVALREELLGIKGIGPETADDILLYACDKSVFVVDAYTHRICERHGLLSGKKDYETLRAWFEKHLPPDRALYREYHGLIVWTGKEFCRPTPRCAGCPLACFLDEKA